jgi:hypothetical protein
MDELGKSLPITEGIVEAELGRTDGPKNEHCLNCGTKLLDSYCHHCGQRDLPKRQTLRELIENFIGSFFSFESKFFRTVKFLLFNPGFLPLEYAAGKRESYFHPARAYVFISFIFFTLLFALPDADKKSQSSESNTNKLEEGAQYLEQIDSLSGGSVKSDSVIMYGIDGKKIGTKKRDSGFSLSDTPFNSVREYDSAQQLLAEDKRDGWLTRTFEIKNIELKKHYKGEDGRKQFKKDFVDRFFNSFPKVLFFLLPVFAAILKLLYIRRDFYYSEHLVFSVVYFNFFYLASSVILLVNLIPAIGNWLTAATVIWIIIYLPIAMKRMYKQSKRKTILKFSILFFTFTTCLALGVTASILLILFNL